MAHLPGLQCLELSFADFQFAVVLIVREKVTKASERDVGSRARVVRSRDRRVIANDMELGRRKITLKIPVFDNLCGYLLKVQRIPRTRGNLTLQDGAASRKRS